MHQRFRTIVLLWCVLQAAAPVSARAGDVDVSVTEYVTRLTDLADAIGHVTESHPEQVDAIAARAAGVWRVQTPQRTFEIDMAPIERAMRAWRQDPSPDARGAIAVVLRTMAAEATTLDRPVPDFTGARERLAGILARPEFAPVEESTALARLRRAIARWLQDLLDSLPISAFPSLPAGAVYALLALALGLLGWILARTIRRRPRVALDFPTAHPVPPRAWNVLLDDARAAAAAGDWRQAIRLAHSCGISFLESRGVWPHGGVAHASGVREPPAVRR